MRADPPPERSGSAADRLAVERYPPFSRAQRMHIRTGCRPLRLSASFANRTSMTRSVQINGVPERAGGACAAAFEAVSLCVHVAIVLRTVGEGDRDAMVRRVAISAAGSGVVLFFRALRQRSVASFMMTRLAAPYRTTIADSVSGAFQAIHSNYERRAMATD